MTQSLVRQWDAQIEAANGDDVAASIGILRCSQASHQAWLDYIESGDCDDVDRSDGLLESDFHRRCIEQYEQIIGVIERLRDDS